MKTTCFQLNLCVWLNLFLLAPQMELHSKGNSFFLECPPSVTIKCYDDISDLDKWGKAYIWKNNTKTLAPAPVKIVYYTNACGIGTIIRYWEVEDPYKNIQKCHQVITVTSSLPFGINDISWPPAYTIEGCNPVTDPRSLPSPYDYPTFSKLKCSQPMHSYKDMKFTVSEGCMKILRDWKVIDWCQFQPNANPPVGVWTYTQVIKLVLTDSTAKLICPLDTVVEARMDCKGIFVKLDSAKAITKCGFPLIIRNTSPYSKNKGPDASGDYPLGTTEFYFISEYGCGKEIKCKVKVTVKNKIGPSPYCLNGLIVALMPVDTNKDGTPDDGMIEVWAKDFNLGSFHKCGYKQLKYSFSSDTSYTSRIFTCADLGRNEVEMWVTDSLGNQSYCKTYLEVQNNNAKIPDCKRKDSLKSGIVLAGFVEGVMKNSISDVGMNLYMDPQFTVVSKTDTLIRTRFHTILTKSGLIFYVWQNDTTFIKKFDTLKTQWNKEIMSDAYGAYAFKELIKNEHYHLDINKRESHLKGINLDDVIVLLQHLSGSKKLTDPLKLIAADVNADTQIDHEDFELLYALVLGTASYNSLPKHWRFIPASFVFSNPANPFIDVFEYTMDFKNISTSVTNLDFTAVKVGELDGNSSGFTNQTIDIRNFREQNENQTLDFLLLNVYPNPSTDQTIYFQLDIFQSKTLTINFYDVQGNLLQQNSRSFDKGNQIWDYSVNLLTHSGMLFYSITDGKQTQFGKLIRSK